MAVSKVLTHTFWLSVNYFLAIFNLDHLCIVMIGINIIDVAVIVSFVRGFLSKFMSHVKHENKSKSHIWGMQQ